MKAYSAWWKGVPQVTAYIIAETRGQAKSTAKQLIEEAGWYPPFNDIICKRAPQYDEYARRINKRRALRTDEEHNGYSPLPPLTSM